MATIRTLDYDQERKVRRREGKFFDKKPKGRRRKRRDEAPPEFNPRDWR